MKWQFVGSEGIASSLIVEAILNLGDDFKYMFSMQVLEVAVESRHKLTTQNVGIKTCSLIQENSIEFNDWALNSMELHE